jgi:CRISPR-associated exonuclease Cas4
MNYLFLGITVAILLISLILLITGFRRNARDAVPTGSMVYGDLHSRGATMRSHTYGLSGKPDMVVKSGRNLIPYEYKNTDTAKPRDGHLVQMGAYFLILEDLNPGLKVPYGIIKYRNSAFKVPNSAQLRGKVLYVADQIRNNTGEPKRNHENPMKCMPCSFREICTQSLIILQR